MPDPSGVSDVGKSLTGQVGQSVPALSSPFQLTLCGVVAWIAGGTLLLAVLIAMGFAAFNNPADASRFLEDSEFDPSGGYIPPEFESRGSD